MSCIGSLSKFADVGPSLQPPLAIQVHGDRWVLESPDD